MSVIINQTVTEINASVEFLAIKGSIPNQEIIARMVDLGTIGRLGSLVPQIINSAYRSKFSLPTNRESGVSAVAMLPAIEGESIWYVYATVFVSG